MVSRVTSAAASAAGQLPGPLGPAAAQTVETAAGALVPSAPAGAVQLPNQAARLPAQQAALASVQ